MLSTAVHPDHTFVAERPVELKEVMMGHGVMLPFFIWTVEDNLTVMAGVHLNLTLMVTGIFGQ